MSIARVRGLRRPNRRLRGVYSRGGASARHVDLPVFRRRSLLRPERGLDRPYGSRGRRATSSDGDVCGYGPCPSRQVQFRHGAYHAAAAGEHFVGRMALFLRRLCRTDAVRIILSTVSIFPSKQAYRRYVYRDHRLSSLACQPILWCCFCERFLVQDQFDADREDHFERYWEEVWSSGGDPRPRRLAR